MERKEKGFLVAQIYEEIKQRIIRLELRPGQILNDRHLMVELGVGRTPIREAILMLKNEDLVVGYPNKSTHVRELSLKDFKDLSESLIGIEKLTTSLAALRITPDALKEITEIQDKFEEAINKNDFDDIVSKNREFHISIANACNNRYLININKSLRNEIIRLSYLAVLGDFGNNPKLLVEHYGKMINYHRKFITLLREKNTKQIRSLCVKHIRVFQERITHYLSSYLT